MAKNISKNLLLSLGMLISFSTYANYSHEDFTTALKDYQTMHVSITNNTDNDCSRVNIYITHGKLVEGSSIPAHINKGETITYIMQEGTLTGPDVIVTYRCGKDGFRVRAWQRQCWLAYGCDAHGEVLSNAPTISIDEPVEVTNASRYWNQYGTVNFMVRNK